MLRLWHNEGSATFGKSLFLSGLWFLPILITLGSFVLQLVDVSIYLSLCSHSKNERRKTHQERTRKKGQVMPNWGAVFCGVRHMCQQEIFPEDIGFGPW